MVIGKQLNNAKISFLATGLVFMLLVLSISTGHAIPETGLQAGNDSDTEFDFFSPRLKEQRAQFLEAETAIRKKHYSRYKKLEAELKDYPLYPYLRFRWLSKRLSHTSNQEIQDFLLKHHSSPLARKLYHRWMVSLARRGKSRTLIRYFEPTENTRLLCHYASALHKTGERTRAYNLMNDLWLTSKSLPKSCDYIIGKWKKAGHMTSSRLWARIKLVMKKGKRRFASYLGKSLPREEKFWLSLWKKVQRNPEFVVKANKHFKDQHSPIMHWILVDGMSRLAWRKPLKAAEYWKEIRDKYHFTGEEKESIERRLALSLARAGTPVGHETLKELELDSNNSKVIRPHILSAIQEQDWNSSLEWLNRLKSNDRYTDRWQYWRARTLEEMGRLDEARSLYLQITDNRNFYSFLAADRIGDRYKLTHRPVKTTRSELLQLQHIPAIQRAGELYQLNRIVDARREWQFGIQRMDKQQLLIAADLANKWGWHDRSIVTLALARYWDDLELRFPLAHKNYISKMADQEKINPAWAFAVIRQESAFTRDARSSAGALGLMQLMPNTARQVAQSLRIKRPKHRDLLNSNINIKLGVRYLRKLSERFGDNKVLATAAYNAGQWRVKGWLPEENEQSADLWIENVPFKETRKYLKRVLTYTVIYEQRLGLDSKPLLERMRPISRIDKKL